MIQSLTVLPENSTDYSQYCQESEGSSKMESSSGNASDRREYHSSSYRTDSETIEERDYGFRSKKVHVQSPRELRYNGIPNYPEVHDFAWCLVRNLHELDKVLER